MYKLFGYVLEHQGNISSIIRNKAAAKEECAKAGIPESCIVQLFRFERYVPQESNNVEIKITGVVDDISKSNEGAPESATGDIVQPPTE